MRSGEEVREILAALEGGAYVHVSTRDGDGCPGATVALRPSANPRVDLTAGHAQVQGEPEGRQ